MKSYNRLFVCFSGLDSVLLPLWLCILAFGLWSEVLGDTRIDSLSSDPRLVEDLDVIWMYPEKTLEYQDTADFRFNNSAVTGLANPNGFGSLGSSPTRQFEWGGVIDGKQKDIGVLGVYVNRPFAPLFYTVYGGYWRPVGGATPWASSSLPSNKLDLFWAQTFGSMDFGVRLNYGDMQNNGSDYARAFGAEMGVGFKGNGAFSQANFHAGYSLGTFQNGPIADNGIFSLSAGALLQHDMSPDDNLRFFTDFGLDQYQDTTGTNISHTLTTLGLACTHELRSGKGLLSTGLVANNVGGSGQANWIVGWNGSVEDALTNWLVLRAGLFKVLFDRQTSGGVTSDPTIPNTTVFNLGAELHWENWMLDARVGIRSLETDIQNFQPGNGISFSNNGAALITLTEADLRYQF
ncbi:MAG TPA: hypothetical protein VIJ93_04540 [bacterium]